MLATLILAFSCWHWDGVPDADVYRVCWSAHASVYSACDCVEVSGTTCLSDSREEPVIPNPGPGELVFIVVIACNEYGCSDTEHGPMEECPP